MPPNKEKPLFEGPKQGRQSFSLAISPASKGGQRVRAFAAAGLMILAFAAHLFLTSLILKKKDSLVQAVADLSTEQLKEEELRVLRASFEESKELRGALDRHFINSEEIVGFIEDIERIAKKTNALLAFNYVNIRGGGSELAIDFDAFGDFSEVFSLLDIVEQFPVRLSVERLIFDKQLPKNFIKRKESDTWHATVTLVIKSFEQSK